jgi:hypothetical protein
MTIISGCKTRSCAYAAFGAAIDISVTNNAVFEGKIIAAVARRVS